MKIKSRMKLKKK